MVQALDLCAHHPRAADQIYIVSAWATLEDMVGGLSAGAGVSYPRRRIPMNLAMFLALAMQWWPRWPLTLSRVQAMSVRSRYSTKKSKGIGVEIDCRSRACASCTRFGLMSSTIVFCNQPSDECRGIYVAHIRALKLLVPVEVIANSNERTLLQQQRVDIPIDCVQIVRPIALWSDIRALWVLYWRFKKGRPSAVHTITPKAGLLGMMGAWLARVPVRVHSFTGQVWFTRTGFQRWLLKLTDKLIAAMATDVLVDSPSQRAFLIKQGVVTAEGSIVLGAGSICGVDISAFVQTLRFVRF